jgi:predicted enzyme related to lactoylglutathione lyase
MSSADTRGQFVWHELMTTDTAGAGAFYPRIAGWKTQAWDKDTSYTLWIGNAGPMGGVMSLGGEAAASHWMPYIGTPDVPATVEAAKALGATVCRDCTEVSGAGTFAVLQDPQGAVFAVFTPAMPGGDVAPPQAQGDFSWHELSTTDFAAALRFYTELFGWEKGPTHDMGELGYYQIFVHGGKQIGGIFNMSPGVTTPHWLSYVRVDDVDEATDAAKAAGGRVINGPMEVPGGDWIAQLLDPQGAVFAVHEVKARRREAVAEPAKAAKPATPAAKTAKAAKPAMSAFAKPSPKVAQPVRARKAVPKKKRVAAKSKSAAAARKRSMKGKARVAAQARKKAAVKARSKTAKRSAKKRATRRSAAARKPRRRSTARGVRAKRRR